MENIANKFSHGNYLSKGDKTVLDRNKKFQISNRF